MATLFTRIIGGELPAQFVWKDDLCVAFLSIAPLGPGHTLVVPRAEVDHWLDLDPDGMAHLARVAQAIGKGVARAFDPVKVGSIILGLEVPHVHIHVAPVWTATDLDFHNAKPDTPAEEIERAAEKLRDALRDLGYAQVSE